MNGSTSAYWQLGAAIGAELIGTSALKLSDGMARMGPAVLVVVGYIAAFWLMSMSLKSLPVGLVYAVWAGTGVVAMKLIGIGLFGESASLQSFLGIAMVATGVVLLHFAR
jgi:small multidrug resistance pump